MRLQILIPQFKENEEVISPLLCSLAIQQNVNLQNEVGVIIVNDGSDTLLAEDFLNSFPFEVRYLKREHNGVSAARNACLDASSAEYVMFCDADDMFFNACGLWIVFREMESGFDALNSVFVEETRDPYGGVVYINRQMDSTFVHGKIYRREYLIENGIRFNPKLTIHEDSYFNCLAQRMCKEVKYCPTPFYLWKWRDDSVCRHDPKYILKTYKDMLDSNTALVEEFQKRGRESDAQFCAVNMVYDAYYTMNKAEWMNQENQTFRMATERRFKDYYLTNKRLFDAAPVELKSQIIVGQKNRFFGEGMFLESITFDDWIKHITELN